MAELAGIERAIADAKPALPAGHAPGLDSESLAWRQAAAEAGEYILLVDAALDVRFLNHVQPGGPDPVGMPLRDFVHVDDRDALQTHITRARDTHRMAHCVARAAGPNGSMVPYSVWVIPPGQAAPGDLTCLICSDLGQQQRVERELQDERSALRSILGNAPDVIMVVDREHRIRFANHVAHGFERAQVMGHPAESFLPPEHQARVHAAIERVFDGAEGTSYETAVDTPTGTHWFSTRAGPVVVEGRVDRVSLISTDITERKRIDEERAVERDALAESEARFRTLVDSAPEAMVILDAGAGRFLDVNPRACALFDAPREQLLTLGPADLSPRQQPDGRDSVALAREHIGRAMAGEELSFEWMHRTASGQPRPCEVRLVRLPGKERQLLRGSMTDIRVRKQAEEERERMREELFQAQKMQAIGQLTGGVAHDFNNLLTVIISHVELLDLDAEVADEVRTHAKQILDASHRAAELTRHLLAFARRQPPRPQRVDLGELVGGMAQLLQRTLGEAVAVRCLPGADLWACEADPAQLENVILNLAINARDAMPRGGELRIRTHNERLAPKTDRGGQQTGAGAYVVLQVQDDGGGMSPEVAKQAFEPFFTTKEVGSGSGLGLSMVYGFVQQSGGHVELHSEAGQGTTVTIYLPRCERAGGTSAPSSGSQLEPRGDGQLLLVVEDDAQVRALTVAKLERLGYRVVDAADAAAAQEALRARPDVALVLTDVVLAGGKDGAELAVELRGERPSLPVVFMSGYPRNALGRNTELLADIMLVQKPFSRAQLALAIHAALSELAERGTPA